MTQGDTDDAPAATAGQAGILGEHCLVRPMERPRAQMNKRVVGTAAVVGRPGDLWRQVREPRLAKPRHHGRQATLAGPKARSPATLRRWVISPASLCKRGPGVSIKRG